MATSKNQISLKRIALDKENASLLLIISVAIFFIIFSVVAIKALYNQMTYQSKVIDRKEKTLNLANQNISELEKLDTAYKEFSNATENAIGGNPKGAGDRDGENARIVLDALPSKYDYPALLTSLSKLVQNGGFSLKSITGTDDEVNQAQANNGSSSAPIEMPFTLEATINSADGVKFMQLFEKSIRPIQVSKLTLQGQDAQLNITVSGNTYFQPEKKLNITKEVVR